jgi:hypothetical protein
MNDACAYTYIHIHASTYTHTHTANIDNSPDNVNKICVGTFGGMLRIYYPRSKTGEYTVEDLMLEKNLDLPILGVAAGMFVPNSNRVALAVLHPRHVRLCVRVCVCMAHVSTFWVCVSIVDRFWCHSLSLMYAFHPTTDSCACTW